MPQDLGDRAKAFTMKRPPNRIAQDASCQLFAGTWCDFIHTAIGTPSGVYLILSLNENINIVNDNT
ncbi:hypothetical protein NT01EI_0969 [Edwardsiella ictaluri 93-146]|uniref:Uncharacterized protein n=1 Tax=Edwardsiella ictaluri (strain 93-146) TaxID=634503 RepID=C5BBE7_EDWI9|nr:hypothetical protein NT01EI_0969 [Edwardsiella ictaluri 93-146]